MLAYTSFFSGHDASQKEGKLFSPGGWPVEAKNTAYQRCLDHSQMELWHTGCHYNITEWKINNNIYRSDTQVTFELESHFMVFQVIYLK